MPRENACVVGARWVLKDQGAEVRSRLVANDFAFTFAGPELYAAPPEVANLRLLLALSAANRARQRAAGMSENMVARVGDVPTAFLNAELGQGENDSVLYQATRALGGTWLEVTGVVWKGDMIRLRRALGLIISTRAWQDWQNCWPAVRRI